jgi:protein SCO1
MRSNSSGERSALFALVLIVIVTIGWWAAALWPLPPATPEWVVRARAACFGTTDTGMPNAGGWLLLVGAPISTAIAVLMVFGGEISVGVRRIAATRRGSAGLLATSLLLLLLAGAAAMRVASAYGYGLGNQVAEAATLGEPQRLSREAPPLSLLDQQGATRTLESFRGRPVIVTFAYGKCETVCPVIVHNARAAVKELRGVDPVLLIVTVDPWRDVPARLGHIAAAWELPEGAYFLGGTVQAVEATLDAWEVSRARDLRTGGCVHPSLAYIVDVDGRIKFATTGSTRQMVEAVRQLQTTSVLPR